MVSIFFRLQSIRIEQRVKNPFKLSIVPCVLCLPFFAISQPLYLEFSSRQCFAGAQLTYNARAGYIDFESLQNSVAINKPNLLTVGLDGAIRFPLVKMLRLQVALALDAGSATDDTLFTAQPSLDKYFYYHAALEPSLHCALAPASWRVVPFVSLGAGLNVVWVNERTFFVSDPSQEVIYTDRYYVNAASWSVSASAGLGVDVAISRNVGVSLLSTFRYLYPVFYNVEEDFPLYAMHYTETLCGNVTWLGVIIRL